MKFSVDEIGFPLVEIEGMGSINLWPVTKFQFERFMAETNLFGDKWYDNVLTLNPRISFRTFGLNDYEKLFISGVRPQEALEYAHWLGNGYDLLTIEEWRTFRQSLGVRSIPELPGNLAVSADHIWNKLANHFRTLNDMTLMHDGLIEWVKKETKFVGLGTPRPSFLQNAINPLADEWVPLRERVFYLGFRLIRR